MRVHTLSGVTDAPLCNDSEPPAPPPSPSTPSLPVTGGFALGPQAAAPAITQIASVVPLIALTITPPCPLLMTDVGPSLHDPDLLALEHPLDVERRTGWEQRD